MEINVLSPQDPRLFNRFLFPDASPETKSWLAEQFQRGQERLSELGRQVFTQATQLYQSMNDPSLMRQARALTRGVKNLFHPNAIVPLDTVEAVQAATPVMQRYLMAQPSLRKLYHQQRCDGYSDSYVDVDPGVRGEAHYDYRRVMNGIVVDYVKEDGEDGWKSVMYPDDLREGDRELESDERFIVLRGWDLVEAALAAKRDPSDIFNGKLDI